MEDVELCDGVQRKMLGQAIGLLKGEKKEVEGWENKKNIYIYISGFKIWLTNFCKASMLNF